MTLEERYQNLCQKEGWQPDPCHLRVLKEVSPVFMPCWQKRPWYRRRPSAQILYFYGAVGRGKTMLATLIYEAISVPKARWHMTAFIQYLHARQHAHDSLTVPQRIVQALVPYEVLLIDEFHIYDMGNAMLLARVLPLLYQQRVSMIFTSNMHPLDLHHTETDPTYSQPLIQLLNQDTHLFKVDNVRSEDYRTRCLDRAEASGNGSQPQDIWEQFQEHHAPMLPYATELHVNGRRLVLSCTFERAVFLDMAWVCAQNLGAVDFLAIAQRFSTIYLRCPIDLLNSASREKLQRFMILIDVFYDHNIAVHMSPLQSPKTVRNAKAMTLLPFERTWSRVQALQAYALSTVPE